jgi:D-glycero-alpha-D-manno-heptose 1-phosphate guanylyltransferase
MSEATAAATRAAPAALRGMQALILAGGAGTRLRSIVSDRPKPMAEVAGRPFLEHQIAWLARQGVAEVILCVGYLHEHVQRHFAGGRSFGVPVHCSVEPRFLGTAGALKQTADRICGPFLALNGDSWLDVDLAAVARGHRERVAREPRSAGTLVLTRVDDASGFGSVALDDAGRILRFDEKVGSAGEAWISAGIYLLEPGVLDRVAPGEAVSLEREVFPSLLRDGQVLWGHPAPGFFVDIGTPEGYRRFGDHVEQYMRRQP